MAESPNLQTVAGGRLPRFLFLALVAATTAVIVWLSLASRDMTWPPPAADIALHLESTRKLAEADRARQQAMEQARLKRESAAQTALLEKQREAATRRKNEERAAQLAQQREAEKAEQERRRTARLAELNKQHEAEKAHREKERAAQLAQHETDRKEKTEPASPAPAVRPEPPAARDHDTASPDSAGAAPEIPHTTPPPARLARKRIQHDTPKPAAPKAPAHAAPKAPAHAAPEAPAHATPAPHAAPPTGSPVETADGPEEKFPGSHDPASQIATEPPGPLANPRTKAPPGAAAGAPKNLIPPGEPETPAKAIPLPPALFRLARLAPGTPLKPAPDPALIEDTELGGLPVIGKNGKQPWKAYARPFDENDKRPRVGIIVGGLGLDGVVTRIAIEGLPSNVTLAFVPYAEKLEMWTRMARAAGHEILLSVPMEPQDYPTIDPGPKALLTSLDPKENRARLLWSLSRVSGYIGISNFMGSRFTLSRLDMLRVFRELKKRGLMFVDSRSGPHSAVAAVAADVGVPWIVSSIRLGAKAEAASIDSDLEQLEKFALKNGRALGMASPLPVTFDRIARWIKTLDKKGFALAPASAIIKAESEK